MDEIQLVNSLGDARANSAVQAIVRLYEQVFPQHIVSYYIEGSYASGTQVATSDLDIAIIFADRFASHEEKSQKVQRRG